MHQGGNRQFRLFLESLDITSLPDIEVLYHSKAAALYRAKLRKQVELVMSGIPIGVTISQSLEVSQRVYVDMRADEAPVTVKAKVSRYSVLFPVGAMGMTVTKDPADNRAYVSKIVSGSAAERGGVEIGDFVEGVAGKYISDFDIIMHMIPLMPRPVQIIFSRAIHVVSADSMEETDLPFPSPDKSPSKESSVGLIHHTTSSPSLVLSSADHSSHHPISGRQMGGLSPTIVHQQARRRKKKNGAILEKAKITLLKSESMAIAEHDSDSDETPILATPQASRAQSLGILSTSLETGMRSAKSTPSKSPRSRGKIMSSASDEVKSDPESVYNTPGNSFQAHRAWRSRSPGERAFEDDSMAYHELLKTSIASTPDTPFHKSGDAEKVYVPTNSRIVTRSDVNSISTPLTRNPSFPRDSVAEKAEADLPSPVAGGLEQSDDKTHRSSNEHHSDTGRRSRRSHSGEYLLKLKVIQTRYGSS